VSFRDKSISGRPAGLTDMSQIIEDWTPDWLDLAFLASDWPDLIPEVSFRSNEKKIGSSSRCIIQSYEAQIIFVALLDRLACTRLSRPWLFFGHVDRFEDSIGFFGAAEPGEGRPLGNGWSLDPRTLLSRTSFIPLQGRLTRSRGCMKPPSISAPLAVLARSACDPRS
jgi:hypothetical protein